MGNSPWVYVFIFFGKLIEVSLSSLRSQLIHKGETVIGAFIAFFEYSFWLCITASVISGFSGDIIKIIILVCAFAGGNVLGSILEGKIALGFCTLNCVFTERESAIKAAELLRQNGFGLTLFSAEGMNGAARSVLSMTANRKHVSTIKGLLLSVDADVVVSVLVAQQPEGGTMTRLRGRSAKRLNKTNG
jgi:uncharacterized protein YebE (UPF0316 family)